MGPQLRPDVHVALAASTTCSLTAGRGSGAGATGALDATRHLETAWPVPEKGHSCGACATRIMTKMRLCSGGPSRTCVVIKYSSGPLIVLWLV